MILFKPIQSTLYLKIRWNRFFFKKPWTEKLKLKIQNKWKIFYSKCQTISLHVAVLLHCGSFWATTSFDSSLEIIQWIVWSCHIWGRKEKHDAINLHNPSTRWGLATFPSSMAIIKSAKVLVLGTLKHRVYNYKNFIAKLQRERNIFIFLTETYKKFVNYEDRNLVTLCWTHLNNSSWTGTQAFHHLRRWREPNQWEYT